MIYIPYQTVTRTLSGILTNKGFTPDQAALSARLFADANRDGVISHGMDRFKTFLRAMELGLVDPAAKPEMTWSGGALERWNGHFGPGNLNAHSSMGRALELSELHGVGCVALANTNHWIRGGNFGWQAVDAGKIGICWTNTMPNLPPWGSANPLIGNNPLIIAVPGDNGKHVVLDMAMSQFSYGALSRHSREGRKLQVPGGYDSEGNLTDDAALIMESVRPLPTGFWKGSGLAIMLDLMAAMLSGGNSTSDIIPDLDKEKGVSQVFIAFSPPDYPGLADRVIASLQNEEGSDIRYPGERTLKDRRKNMKKGLPVDKDIWNGILALA
ncbi:MAG: 3-dehydro-L-gulonate 2-dehydrogenase [Spirochaetaceae bacterium]|nr:3-dehydro-L-gulonate 2-dehydrogenase [Spirochaetaceae bacterium]